MISENKLREYKTNIGNLLGECFILEDKQLIKLEKWLTIKHAEPEEGGESGLLAFWFS